MEIIENSLVNSKVMSVRVPFDFYIQQLKNAAKLKLSLSEYLIISLSDANIIESNNKELVADKSAINKLESEIETLKKKIQSEQSNLSKQSAVSQEKEKSLRNEILELQKKVSNKSKCIDIIEKHISKNTGVFGSIDSKLILSTIKEAK